MQVLQWDGGAGRVRIHQEMWFMSGPQVKSTREIKPASSIQTDALEHNWTHVLDGSNVTSDRPHTSTSNTPKERVLN